MADIYWNAERRRNVEFRPQIQEFAFVFIYSFVDLM